MATNISRKIADVETRRINDWFLYKDSWLIHEKEYQQQRNKTIQPVLVQSDLRYILM